MPCLPLNCIIFRQHENILKKYENDKEVNKDFKHVTDCIDKIEYQYPEPGRFVTNCTVCTDAPSCHDDCAYEKDEDKVHCSAMDSSGLCMHCKCHWSKHQNMKYKLGQESHKQISFRFFNFILTKLEQ